MSGLDQNQIVSSNWYSVWAYTCITAMFVWQRDLRVHVPDTYTFYSGIIRTAIENLALSLTSTEYTLHSPSMVHLPATRLCSPRATESGGESTRY